MEEDTIEEISDLTCPIVKVTKEERRELCRPWKKALIVKLLRKKLGIRFLNMRFQKL